MKNWGQAIRKQVRESKRLQLERGFFLCEKQSEVHVCKGDECHISPSESYRKRCKRGDGQYLGFFHTHPGGKAEQRIDQGWWKGYEHLYDWHKFLQIPSVMDIKTAKDIQERISCTVSVSRKSPSTMLCFSPVGKDMKKLQRISMNHNDAVQRYSFAVAYGKDFRQHHKDYENLFTKFLRESNACQIQVQ